MDPDGNLRTPFIYPPSVPVIEMQPVGRAILAADAVAVETEQNSIGAGDDRP